MAADDEKGTGNGVVPNLNGTAAQAALGQRVVLGKVAAPDGQEATSDTFYFWVPTTALIERSQLVVSESVIATRNYTFYGLVEETYRGSRKRSMAGEVDEADGDVGYQPPFVSDGYTYAKASILRTEPAVFTSPRERSTVYLATEEDAQRAYRVDEMGEALAIGLVKNGGEQLAGVGCIDLDYLLGAVGGHMVVNGTTGRGTKTSFLLTVLWLLLRRARRQQNERPSAGDRLRLVPITFNVKNFDLFYLDRPNSRFDPAKHLGDWQDLGVEDPMPFSDVRYFAPQQPGSLLPTPTGRTDGVAPYSWSLGDVVAAGLVTYLFAEADVQDANFSALVLDIEDWLTEERVENDGAIRRQLRRNGDRPNTFGTLLEWVRGQARLTDAVRALSGHHSGTWGKLARRLVKLVFESGGVLRRDDQQGNPLDLRRADTSGPIVIDLAALAAQPDLQRFVVATVFRQLVAARTGAGAVRGLVYVVMIDELNRFAPRGGRDPITQLIEMVASEMRSQGIILFGAQQQASKVSEKVIENAGIRALGKSGSLELTSPIWRFLGDSARRKAETLPPNEKLIVQDNFREPLHIRVPFPAWAMNPKEAATPVLARSGRFGAIDEYGGDA